MVNKEKMEELKNEIINSLNGYINAETEEKSEDVDKTCNNIINKFIEIAYELRIPINEDYIRSQMSITKNQIVEELQNSNEYLSEGIYLQLNKITNNLIEETEELIGERGTLENLIDNKRQERKQDYMRIEGLIDERIKDLVSNASKRLYNLQLSHDEESLDQLKYYINQVKNDEIKKTVESLGMKDVVLFENIENKIEEFCREVEVIKKQKEAETEKKSWELSEEEAENINPQKAIEEAKKAQIRKNEHILDLPDNILE